MSDSRKLRLLYVYCIAWKMLQALQQFSLGYRHCIVQTAMIGSILSKYRLMRDSYAGKEGSTSDMSK
jgi:hypothetical protein